LYRLFEEDGPLDSQFGSLEYVLELYAENNVNPYGKYFFLPSASLFSIISSAGGPPDVGSLSHEECRAATPVAEIKREVTPPPPQVQLSELEIWKGRARQSAMAIARLLGDLADREKADKWEAKAESATRALQDIQARLGDVKEQLEFGIF
jgi:hypothetical protein